MTRYYETPDTKSADIIYFPPPKPPRRGRPKSARKGTDTGTPELVMKRAHGETAEPLDLLLEHDYITKDQHWCGIHLRWLHTLRFGAPSVRTLDLTGGITAEITLDDPEWRAAREAEYHEAIGAVNILALALLCGVCVHNERPRFLTRTTSAKPLSSESVKTLEQLRGALDALAALWGRGKRKE